MIFCEKKKLEHETLELLQNWKQILMTKNWKKFLVGLKLKVGMCKGT